MTDAVLKPEWMAVARIFKQELAPRKIPTPQLTIANCLHSNQISRRRSCWKTNNQTNKQTKLVRSTQCHLQKLVCHSLATSCFLPSQVTIAGLVYIVRESQSARSVKKTKAGFACRSGSRALSLAWVAKLHTNATRDIEKRTAINAEPMHWHANAI